jgi:hypothetical protein
MIGDLYDLTSATEVDENDRNVDGDEDRDSDDEELMETEDAEYESNVLKNMEIAVDSEGPDKVIILLESEYLRKEFSQDYQIATDVLKNIEKYLYFVFIRI